MPAGTSLTASGIPDRLSAATATYVDDATYTYAYDGLLADTTYGTAAGNQAKVPLTMTAEDIASLIAELGDAV